MVKPVRTGVLHNGWDQIHTTPKLSPGDNNIDYNCVPSQLLELPSKTEAEKKEPQVNTKAELIKPTTYKREQVDRYSIHKASF